jgi:excisionase family DNA binding protein
LSTQYRHSFDEICLGIFSLFLALKDDGNQWNYWMGGYSVRREKTERKAVTPEMLKGRLMLRVHEYAALTGTPVPSVYRYLTLGKLPAIRTGGTVRIPVSAILDQIQEATRG